MPHAVHHAVRRFSMLRIALGPSSQKTVTNDLMLSTAQLARQHPGVRLHTHLAENQVRYVLYVCASTHVFARASAPCDKLCNSELTAIYSKH